MSIIKVNNLSFKYEGSTDKIFENVSFLIDTDWKLGLIGRNGKGKTTLLKILSGKYEYSGSLQKNVEMDYFPFTVKNKEKMAIEIVQDSVPFIEDWQIIKENNLLNSEPDMLYRKYSTLSGGEQVKIQIISLFLKENNFLLIDEPTNHLDSQTKEHLVKYLKNKKGFILVSHDRDFIDNVVDHIISIENTNIYIEKGNFSSWKENKDKKDNFEIAKNEMLKKDIKKLETASKNKATWANKTEESKIGQGHVDRGFIGHRVAKLMKTSKVLQERSKKAIEEKSNLLKDTEKLQELTIKPIKNQRSPLISIKDLQVKYDNKIITKKISFEIQEKDRIAIVGKNGKR